MGLLGSISSAFKGHFDKNKEQKEIEERVRKEAQVERLDIYEEELRRNAFEVVKIRAKNEALNSSGLQKLRQVARVSDLENRQPAPGSFLEKLRNHTQKNLANRDRNLQKTAKLRKTALEIKKENQVKINKKNKALNVRKTAFGTPSTWGR